jgi:hypothetical protein
VLLPYRTPEGFLGLRVWRRDVHAEVAAMAPADGAVRLTGRLVGAVFGAGAPALEFRRAGVDPLVEPVAVDPGGFAVSMPARRLAGRHAGTGDEVWALWLRYDDTAAPVRIGRLLDDVLDKRAAYVLPGTVLSNARIQPFYTETNELSVRVTCTP